MNRGIDTGRFIWLIPGMYWTFSASGEADCLDEIVFKSCLAVIALEISYYFFITFFCCCTSCFSFLAMVLGHAILHAPPGAPSGASQKTINTLKSQKYSEEVKENEEIDDDHATCAICLSDYEKDEEIRFLPCRHHFHKDCVDRWLATNKSCPFCKRCIDAKPEKKTKTEEEIETPSIETV
eukprot:TRINITY_DN20634_c0_g1_i1.p1 TRINITY_DN20634_c0_g1~~TRINITY_DN20634_c0_g1_i1.p1  ORF type:complete len:210 (+),score=22.38 TRINITY_DN20634_c0_g1_i1:89-631(+)